MKLVAAYCLQTYELTLEISASATVLILELPVETWCYPSCIATLKRVLKVLQHPGPQFEAHNLREVEKCAVTLFSC